MSYICWMLLIRLLKITIELTVKINMTMLQTNFAALDACGQNQINGIANGPTQQTASTMNVVR